MSVDTLTLDQVLELDILEQYTQAIGGQVLLVSVDLFAQQYPQYLHQLREHFNKGEYQKTAEQGHLMKGAAGAIGLARLSQWAQMIQCHDASDWMEYTPDIIELLESNYRNDIELLRKYLSKC